MQKKNPSCVTILSPCNFINWCTSYRQKSSWFPVIFYDVMSQVYKPSLFPFAGEKVRRHLTSCLEKSFVIFLICCIISGCQNLTVERQLTDRDFQVTETNLSIGLSSADAFSLFRFMTKAYPVSDIDVLF
jgi:hypothetical protein